MSAIIDQIVATIRQARYGRDVRESIAHGIEVIDDVAEGARDSATQSASEALQSAQNAEQFASNASTSALNAHSSETTASNKAVLAESWAVGGTNTRTGEDTNNAKYWSEQSHDEAEIAGENAEAWAVGTRDGDPVPSTDPAYNNHAKYWAEQAETSVTGVVSWNSRQGNVTPQSGDYDILDISADSQTAGKIAVSDGSGHMIMTTTGQANGIAGLDANGKVPSSQLPSYVDDVMEYASTSAFPATGETGKIYVALNTNKTYRWGGSEYVEISESLALGETSSTAYAGDKGKANADAISALQTTVGGLSQVEANPSSTSSADLTKLRVDNTTYDIQGGHIIRNENGTALTQRKSMQFNNCTITDDSTNNKTIVQPNAPLIVEKTYAQYLADKTNLDASGNVIKIGDQGVVNSASGVSYNNTNSGLTAGNVQGAIDEICGNLSIKNISNQLTVSSHVSSGDISAWRSGQVVQVYFRSVTIDTTSVVTVVSGLPRILNFVATTLIQGSDVVASVYGDSAQSSLSIAAKSTGTAGFGSLTYITYD